MLKRLGYEPALATNGREALACIENASVDLVFMDVQMPVLDGLATTKILCEIYPVHQRPRIVALTANAMGGDQALCLAAGMDDYLSKPIRHEQLVAAIERVAVRRPPAVG
jgi:CheY-like chemotaxis protein